MTTTYQIDFINDGNQTMMGLVEAIDAWCAARSINDSVRYMLRNQMFRHVDRLGWVADR